MLDANMQTQLKQYLANLREPIELVASLDDSEKSAQTRELLTEIAALHDMVSAQFDGTHERRPSFIIRRASDADKWVRFAGLPMGHEFTSLVLALLWAGGHPPRSTPTSSNKSAHWKAITISRCSSRSRATIAPTWCRL